MTISRAGEGVLATIRRPFGAFCNARCAARAAELAWQKELTLALETG